MLWGASAGGHGCLSLTRYLEQLDEQGFKRLGLPGAVFASAPWCDVTGSFPSISRNAHKVSWMILRTNSQDWLGTTTLVIQPSFSRHYSYHAQRDPLMSPAFAPRSDRHFARLFEKGVKMHVDYGEDEKLHDEVEATVGIMREQGLDVDVLEVSHRKRNFAADNRFPGVRTASTCSRARRSNSGPVLGSPGPWSRTRRRHSFARHGPSTSFRARAWSKRCSWRRISRTAR